jgi:hypothetical protein
MVINDGDTRRRQPVRGRTSEFDSPTTRGSSTCDHSIAADVFPAVLPEVTTTAAGVLPGGVPAGAADGEPADQRPTWKNTQHHACRSGGTSHLPADCGARSTPPRAPTSSFHQPVQWPGAQDLLTCPSNHRRVLARGERSRRRGQTGSAPRTTRGRGEPEAPANTLMSSGFTMSTP